MVRRPSVRPHNAQRSSSPKPPIKAKFYVGPPWVGAASRSHDQDGRHAHLYGKNPSKSFSRTGGPIFTKLDMHRGLQSIIVCSNDDPGVTLTYFTARSNMVTWAFL